MSVPESEFLDTAASETPRASSREHSFVLPVGFTDDGGTRHKSIRIRKMTGHEEALLTDRKLRANPGRLITELIASCTQSLGDVVVTPVVAAELTSADRNYVLLELRKLTFGDTIEARYQCTSCGTNFNAVEDLQNFEASFLDDDDEAEISIDLEDGYTDQAGTTHRRAVFRLPKGKDEEKVATLMQKNASRGMNALLTRCLTSIGTMEPNHMKGLGARLFTELTMADRARIEKSMREEMPGVDLRHEIECESCGSEFMVPLDMTNFFSLS